MSDLSLASRPYFYLHSKKCFQILAQFNLTNFLTNSNVAQIFKKKLAGTSCMYISDTFYF